MLFYLVEVGVSDLLSWAFLLYFAKGFQGKKIQKFRRPDGFTQRRKTDHSGA